MLNINMLRIIRRNFNEIQNALRAGMSWSEIQLMLREANGVWCPANDISMYYGLIKLGEELKNKYQGTAEVR